MICSLHSVTLLHVVEYYLQIITIFFHINISDAKIEIHWS